MKKLLKLRYDLWHQLLTWCFNVTDNVYPRWLQARNDYLRVKRPLSVSEKELYVKVFGVEP